MSTEALPLPQPLAKLKNYLSTDPSNELLRSQAVQCAIQYQLWEEANELLQQGLTLAPQSSTLQGHMGFLALRQNDYGKAVDSLEIALVSNPDNAGLRYNLAFAHFYRGTLDAVKELISDKMLNDPSVSVMATLLLARTYHRQGALEDAQDILSRASHIHPENDEIQGLLALLLYETDDNQAAWTLSSELMARGYDSVETLLAHAGCAVEMDEFDVAKSDYLKAAEKYPQAGRAWSGLAQVEFRDFNLEEALKNVNKAVSLMNNHIGTWHIKAWIHVLQNDVAEAEKAFKASYDIDPNFGETHGGLAVIHAVKGEKAEAERAIKVAKRLNPQGFAACYAEMVLLHKKGNPAEANALFEKVMSTYNDGIGVVPRQLVEKRMLELSKKQSETRH